jgi:hypothetical protein
MDARADRAGRQLAELIGEQRIVAVAEQVRIQAVLQEVRELRPDRLARPVGTGPHEGDSALRRRGHCAASSP